MAIKLPQLVTKCLRCCHTCSEEYILGTIRNGAPSLHPLASGQPGRGTVGNCFELFLIRKSFKQGHLCHVGQGVSKNFVANCGVANKLI